jgi:hypothetical protein
MCSSMSRIGLATLLVLVAAIGSSCYVKSSQDAVVECSEDSFPTPGDRCSKADHDDYIACRRNHCLGCEYSCLCGEDLKWFCLDAMCIDPMPPDSDTEGCNFSGPPRCQFLCG